MRAKFRSVSKSGGKYRAPPDTKRKQRSSVGSIHMRSPHTSFAGLAFALFVLQGACAHETQGLVEHYAELDSGGSGGAEAGSGKSTGGAGPSGGSPFSGGR